MDNIRIGGTRIAAIEGDLTAQQVDAIVDPANEHLAAGGGLSAAIVRAGGGSIQDECNAWVEAHGPVSPGVAAVTGAGTLKARHVIHVAGPIYRQGRDNATLLEKAVTAALDAASAAGDRTVALPAISAGIFGYPLAEAARVIAGAAAAWVRRNPDSLDEIRLVGYGDAAAGAFHSAIATVAEDA